MAQAEKKERNAEILAQFLAGGSIYAIAKKHGISWTRVKDILNHVRKKEGEKKLKKPIICTRCGAEL